MFSGLGTGKIEFNDLFFACHAFCMASVQLSQAFMYEVSNSSHSGKNGGSNKFHIERRTKKFPKMGNYPPWLPLPICWNRIDSRNCKLVWIHHEWYRRAQMELVMSGTLSELQGMLRL